MPLLGGAALVVFTREFIDRRILHNVFARELPGLLDNPAERTVLPCRLVLDLLQHLLGEVQALLALVAAGHGASAWVSGKCSTIIPSAHARCQGGNRRGTGHRPARRSLVEAPLGS